ncbi:hypothetical protein [Desulfurispira natronophila]|uniref:Uncharacterized protein n=1 Tax=Desulfurispira natronophila TaxID=682562 RepID=A0A7W7Y3I5_9BACT|nr:hypothetical protein [Desulfurispira natronophila]MBB5021353.1 hypothetical protein [Desulfurispira natronophila]
MTDYSEYCPILRAMFSEDELRAISPYAVLQRDRDSGFINTMLFYMRETTFEIYSDSWIAQEQGMPLIIDYEREGITLVSKDEFMKYFAAHGISVTSQSGGMQHAADVSQRSKRSERNNHDHYSTR